MGLQGRAFQANIFIVDMVFLGDTRSAEELAVFTNMAPERLCRGCGFRVEEKFTHLSRRTRTFVHSFGEATSICPACLWRIGFGKRAYGGRRSPTTGHSLVTNPDCHFLAVLTVLVQSILEGRTDCPISGVFGAGKTRAVLP